MYSIALTSIPPRLHRLGPVLHSLMAQDPAPAQIFLCLPQTFRRFPGRFAIPAFPKNVTVLRPDLDHGPATKALVAARHLAGSGQRLIYCDDDWLMPPTWAAALLAAAQPGIAITGQGFGIDRIGRTPTHDPATGAIDIAQGFSGVLVDPDWLSADDCIPPDPAREVDDIWLSAQLARQSIQIHAAPAARMGMRSAYEDAHALQTTRTSGLTRDEANRACAAIVHDLYGIWPQKG